MSRFARARAICSMIAESSAEGAMPGMLEIPATQAFTEPTPPKARSASASAAASEVSSRSMTALNWSRRASMHRPLAATRRASSVPVRLASHAATRALFHWPA